MSWVAFAESVTEAQRLAQHEDFDFLHRIGESYATLRRYAPEFLDVLKLRAAPAAKDVLDAIEVLRRMNSDNARKVPADAPIDFIKPRWQKLVTDNGIDRRYYELCALSEMKNALRSGDICRQSLAVYVEAESFGSAVTQAAVVFSGGVQLGGVNIAPDAINTALLGLGVRRSTLADEFEVAGLGAQRDTDRSESCPPGTGRHPHVAGSSAPRGS